MASQNDLRVGVKPTRRRKLTIARHMHKQRHHNRKQLGKSRANKLKPTSDGRIGLTNLFELLAVRIVQQELNYGLHGVADGEHPAVQVDVAFAGCGRGGAQEGSQENKRNGKGMKQKVSQTQGGMCLAVAGEAGRSSKRNWHTQGTTTSCYQIIMGDVTCELRVKLLPCIGVPALLLKSRQRKLHG